MHRLIVLGL
uniref:Uncharacterized protein n=1 Tax=Rhizophora mucronata TaxID=61149 RepID=A0A2P2QK42_RHIMU